MSQPHEASRIVASTNCSNDGDVCIDWKKKDQDHIQFDHKRKLSLEVSTG